MLQGYGTELKDLMKTALADRTTRAYGVAWRAFRSFLMSQSGSGKNIDMWDIYRNPNLEEGWIAFLLFLKVQRKVSFSTCQKYFCGVRAALATLGITARHEDMRMLGLAKRAWKNSENHGPPKGKMTVKAMLARLIVVNAGQVAPEETKAFAAVATCFLLLLRIDEFVNSYVSDAKPSEGISSLWLRRTKTKKEGEFALGKGRLLAECLAFLIKGKHPASRVSQGISKHAVQTEISKIMGDQHRGCTSHSMRRGAAQAIYDAGADIDLVKARGRWTSDAWKIYVSTAERSIGGAQWVKNKDKEWTTLISAQFLPLKKL